AFFKTGSIKVQAIPSGSYKWKTSGTAGMFQSLCLSILSDSHFLLVVIDTERTINRPIMRNGDVLPFTVIITGIGKFRIIFTLKFPPFFESLLCTYLRLHKSKTTNSS